MDNQLTLLTQRAMGALGAVIRDAASAGGTENISVAELIDRMQAKLAPDAPPLAEGTDYRVRDGVQQVRLLARDPSRLDLLLPEPAVLQAISGSLAGTGGLSTSLPWPYTDRAAPPEPYDAKAAPKAVSLDQSVGGRFTVDIGEEGFEAFLDPYMAGYVTSQCI